MKIAFLGNFSLPWCTEVHLAATMERLGHQVTRMQEDRTNPADVCKIVDGHDLFFFVRTWGNTLTLDHLAWMRRHGIPSVSYHLDLYVGLKREAGLVNDPFWRTDHVFSPDGSPEAAAVFERLGINHHWMRAGVFEGECEMAAPSMGAPWRDVVFVGGGKEYGHEEWPYRRQLVEWLESTYGDRYHKFGHPQPTMRGRDLNQLYADSKVVVGDTLCLGFTRPNYTSDRVYETIGRGGFIIHPYVEGMSTEFVDGTHLRFYQYGDFDQLRFLIDQHVADDELRERIRRSGFEHVKRNCTYTVRLGHMFRVLDGTADPVQTATGGVQPDAERKAIWDASGQTKARQDPPVVVAEPPPVQGPGPGYSRDQLIDALLADPDIRARVEAVLRGPQPLAALPADGPVKINLGAGNSALDGWVNVDMVACPGIEVVHNLDVFPWPFPDGVADQIQAIDVLEHLPNYTHAPNSRPGVVAFMDECWRILKPSGSLFIQVPHWQGKWTWIDPTHVRGFDPRSFDYWDPDTDFGRSFGFYSPYKYRIVDRREYNGNIGITMEKRP